MDELILLKLPQAKGWIEIEDNEDLLGISRVLQGAYGYKVDRDQCEVSGASAEIEEIIFGWLWDDSVCENRDEKEVATKIMLPGSDVWFAATSEDIMSARIILNNAYGIEITPENTKVKVDVPALQEYVDANISKVKPGMWKNLLYSLSVASADMLKYDEPLKDAIKRVDGWLEK